MSLINDLRNQVEEAVAETWPDFEIGTIDLSTPPKTQGGKFGDYSSAIALQIAKQLKANPLEIAEELKESLGTLEYIQEITVTAPGFVNFILDYDELASDVLYSEIALPSTKPSKIALEHTSVNPNKAAHIGHLRNAALGDSVARILRATGQNIEVQNYIDDLGVQVADSVLAFEESGLKDLDEVNEPIDVWMWHAYSKMNAQLEENEDLKKRRDEILHEMEAGNHELAKKLVSGIVASHRETFGKFGIEYDLEVYEHDIIQNNLWSDLFSELKKKELIYNPTEGVNEGAWLVPFGEDEREHKILVRSNGLPTYTAKDLAYELWKFGKTSEMKGYEKRLKPIDRTITLIDERQSYPREVIRETMIKLGYSKEAEHYHHLGYGVVKLSSQAMKELGLSVEGDKASYSMSGRAGIGVMVRDLLETAKKLQIEKFQSEEDVAEQIAIGSIRYYMLKTRPEREIVFDFDEALKTDGNTGVYLQYAYARANNILAKAESKGSFTKVDLNPQEQELIKQISELEEAFVNAIESLDPSLLCDYAYNLSNAFAKFYETSPVLSVEDNLKAFRIKLVEKYLETMGVCLKVLGIPALSKI